MTSEQTERMSEATYFVRIEGEDAAEADFVEHWTDFGNNHVILDCGRVEELLTDLTEARSQLEEAREWLEPFFHFAKNNARIGPENRPEWCGLRCERERIVDWFGPTDFVMLRKLDERISRLTASPETAEGGE
jgi:hypothetical protein